MDEDQRELEQLVERMESPDVEFTVRSELAQRLREYGVAETVDHTRASLADLSHRNRRSVTAMFSATVIWGNKPTPWNT